MYIAALMHAVRSNTSTSVAYISTQLDLDLIDASCQEQRLCIREAVLLRIAGFQPLEPRRALPVRQKTGKYNEI